MADKSTGESTGRVPPGPAGAGYAPDAAAPAPGASRRRGRAVPAPAAKRTDIQGLRALAVGVVVLYHFWPHRMTGGFVGVDVFFVISGFLITGHLIREVDRTGTVSLISFWSRRVRRLLPLSLLVLLFSLIAALATQPASQIQQALREIKASALYVQNWALATSSIDYLSANEPPSLVQHYWSLSVEEQFYFVWPLLIFASLWVARRFTRTTRSAPLVLPLVTLFVLSLAYSVYETQQSPASAYFISTTRVWEFALGGLLVWVRAPRSESRTQFAMSWGGVAMIVAAAVTFDHLTPFPSYAALLPTLGTALVIVARESGSRLSVSRLFATRPTQLIGDLSYGLYLWHWPLLLLLPHWLGRPADAWDKIALGLFTIALAALTKKFIEDPVRFTDTWIRLPVWTFGLTATCMALVVAVTVTVDRNLASVYADRASGIVNATDLASCTGAAALAPGHDCPDPFEVPADLDTGFAAQDAYWTYGITAEDECSKAAVLVDAPYMSCDLNPDARGLTIALVGDSHADQLGHPLVLAARDRDWRVVKYSKGGCSSFEPDAGDGECPDWSAQVRADLEARTDIDVVLFANRSAKHPIAPAGAVDTWTRLRDTGKFILAVRDLPGFPDQTGVPACIEKNLTVTDPCTWSASDLPDFMETAAAEAEVPMVDLRDLVCPEDTCHAVIGGSVVYFDDNHLSVTFAHSLAPYLGVALDDALPEGLAGTPASR